MSPKESVKYKSKKSDNVASVNDKKKKESYRLEARPKISLIRKIVIYIWILIASILLILLYVFANDIKLKVKEIFFQPVEQIEFETDGVLDGQWLSKYVSIKKGSDIMDVDINAIHDKIVSIDQVKSAVVARKFPDTIKVEINERVPVLRMRVLDGVFRREMLVDADGYVFEGEKLSIMERKSLPFLAGVVLKKNKNNSYDPIEGVNRVCQLLDLARRQYWTIYAQIEVISLEKLSKKDKRPWSKIILQAQFSPRVIFKDYDFTEQLKRLDFILATPMIQKKLPIEQIDLTLQQDVVLKAN